MIKSRSVLDSWYKTFFYGGWTTENGTLRLNKEYEIIEKDLDRLEKLEKVTNLLKELFTFEFRDSGWCYCISVKEDKKQECDYIIACLDKRDYDKQEYNLLKEVFDFDK